MLNRLLFTLLGAGAMATAFAFVKKKEELETFDEAEIEKAIEDAGRRCEEGEISKEAYDELLSALEGLR